jgi:hypothetical protein
VKLLPAERFLRLRLRDILFVFPLQEYRVLFEESGNNPGDKTLEDKFFEYEVVTFDV